MNKDIKLENNDLLFENGDFVISESDNQHIEHIFEVHKGEFKEKPELGFGVNQYVKSNIGKFEFKRNFEEELERDGYNNLNMEITNKGILKVNI